MALVAVSKPSRRVPQNVFYATLWAGVVVTVFFVVLRLSIRWRVFKKIFWDDAFVVFAALCFIGNAIARSIDPDGLSIQYDITTGGVSLTESNLRTLLQSIRIMVVCLILSFCSLWSVKVSFLLFFRRLGSRVRGQKTWWWCVMGVTLATWIINFGLVPYNCSNVSFDHALDKLLKCSEPKAVEFYKTVMRFQVGVDIATDLLIISIPILMLWNVRVPLKQKLGLISLCSLTVFIIAFAAARIAMINEEPNDTPDGAWVYFWANLECTVALIVVSLGSFRQLFTSAQAHTAKTSLPPQNSWSAARPVLSRHMRSLSPSEQSSLMHTRDHSHYPSMSEASIPQKSILVSYEVEVTHDDGPSVNRPPQARGLSGMTYGHYSTRSQSDV